MFNGVNVMSFVFIIGPALVLFARELNMPETWVGLLASTLPVSTLLVVPMVRLVERFGPKRVVIAGWLLRNIVMLSVFLVPLAEGYGESAAWGLLLAAVLGFCIMRAVGVSAWFPWLHEIVPESQRGPFFAAEQFVVQAVSVLATLIIAVILRGDPGVPRYLAIYGIGVAAGFLSLLFVLRIPGGATVPHHQRASSLIDTHAQALRDEPYRLFIGLASLGFAAVAWFWTPLILYMRDALRVSDQNILLCTTAGSAAVLLTIRSWGAFAESRGSGRTMFKTLAGYGATALACTAILPGSPWVLYLAAPGVAAAYVFRAAFTMAAQRAMLHHVPHEGRVGYTNIWNVGTMAAYAVPPVVAGMLIEHFGLWGYRVSFLCAALFAAAAASACALYVRDGAPVVERPSDLVHPMLPVRTFARIAWVTFGLDESARSRAKPGRGHARD